LLACMTANCEPSNQSFETDREATVCTASRRFLPLHGVVDGKAVPGRCARCSALNCDLLITRSLMLGAT